MTNNDYEKKAEVCERGDFPGNAGPLFHGLPPAWYVKRFVAGTATDADTTAAQLELANARIAQLES